MKKDIINIDMNNNLTYIIKGIVISIIFSLASLILFAAILSYTKVPESTIFPVVIILSTLSILVGSSLSTIKIRKNGLLNGLAVGATYILMLYIISSIVNTGFAVNAYTVIMMVGGVMAGVIGGIVGVNIR